MKTRPLSALVAILFFGSPTSLLRADPETEKAVAEIFTQMSAAYAALQTMSADFTYTVNSDLRKQVVEGHARLLKPNYARLIFTRMAEPAFPNVIGSDGELTYTYVPKNFNRERKWQPTTNPIGLVVTADPSAGGLDVQAAQFARQTDHVFELPFFEPGPHDPALAARQASGLAAGGLIQTERTKKDGGNIRLWDSIALQTFFNFNDGISHLYHFTRYPQNFRLEDPCVLEGVACQVISYYYPHGNVEGGGRSAFTHRIFIASNGLIVRYELHFISGGQPGQQVMQLRNIRLNEPMTIESFAFTPPVN